MKSLSSIAISVSLALMGACGTDRHTGDQQVAGDDDQQPGNDQGSGSSAASCPLGAPTFQNNLGAAGSNHISLAVDANGNVFVASGVDASPPPEGLFSGFAEILANGQASIALPMGSLVATDAAGDIFIAGSFTSAIDFGNGVVLQPEGNIDVFLAKLDAKGNLIFARALDLCGDGVAAMVVGKDGRIAVSGSAMGTAVLGANGDVLFTVADFGQVAFDAQGNLVIAGSTDITIQGSQAFLAMFDANGLLVTRTVFEGSAQLTGFGVDAKGAVYLVGFTTDRVNLFGTVVVAHFAIEPGRVTGAFMVKLADGCASALEVRDLGIVEANAIAIDANGQIFIAGGLTRNTGFNIGFDILKIDVRGALSTADLGLPSTLDGRAVAIAVDACGSVYAALVAENFITARGEFRALVLKAAL
jgi:hypothetical protein